MQEELAKENTEDVLIAELDADKYKNLAVGDGCGMTCRRSMEFPDSPR